LVRTALQATPAAICRQTLTLGGNAIFRVELTGGETVVPPASRGFGRAPIGKNAATARWTANRMINAAISAGLTQRAGQLLPIVERMMQQAGRGT
jgi:hypothetical protein